MWRDLQHWIFSLSMGETWVLGGTVAIVLWLFIVFPLAYRTLLGGWGSAPFWHRMAEDPKGAMMLTLSIFVFGPATIWMALLALPFLLLVVLLKFLLRITVFHSIIGTK